MSQHTTALALISAAAAFAAPAFAADACTADIEANDAMQFNTSSMTVPKSCKDFTVKLKHTGKMAKTSMGHNWVLSKTADMASVAADGLTAAASEHVKAGDSRVIAHTRVIGGGESDAVKFAGSKLKAGESYSFFCSFPGHSSLMKGTLQLGK
ncbi:azurin [Polaromonas sp.]|uniref:azurin n=1 Tax=Polaromonas sp. TaxID=1869339 RepID=UPI00386215E5